MSLQPFDIVGYTYNADLACPDCIREWFHYNGPATETTEDVLTRIAETMGIDREKEEAFDSDDFPKVVFRDQAEADDRCGTCGDRLLG